MEYMQLRPTSPEDLDFVRAVESAPENAEFVEQWTLAEHQACLRASSCAHFILETGRPLRAVGYAILQDVDHPDGTVLLRRIAIAGKGRGYGRRAVRALVEYVFTELGGQRLWLSVLTRNRRALRLYRDLGFADDPQAPPTHGSRILLLERRAERQ
ncbi:GNAT family N-acetyltransferase [Halorhodospira halophila]|uniref:GCN5-related N-acetyltransferase n=1 Tax=Halorhodospira halophila (strain DSM 244 / SL1) TaxID=349124 RepID=A1WX53_HALHL|nr:GNAT family N-acetyltransferase [Halorhodospira halophila]ABM62265.1 GCN5-related N-acetyltransferase [Halorhodospira halophila SL1]MBK1729240.1 N-acetyltransferase [Halorhodospira halophila]